MSKILIIDDSQEELDIHKKYLEQYHTVITFQSSLEAVNQLYRIKPDLILLDINMPYLDGFEVLEKVRSMPDGATVPVIGLTGENNKASVVKFMSKGGNTYLVKPVHQELLLNKVTEALELEQKKREKKKILVVDDEMESLFIIKSYLKDDYHVVALNSSKVAIDYLHKFVPDLIILDYNMPLFNGKVAFQIIRQIDKMKDVPIMFLTGEQEKEILVECAALLPAGVLLKSVGKDVIMQKIKEILGK